MRIKTEDYWKSPRPRARTHPLTPLGWIVVGSALTILLGLGLRSCIPEPASADWRSVPNVREPLWTSLAPQAIVGSDSRRTMVGTFELPTGRLVECLRVGPAMECWAIREHDRK